MRTNTPLSIKIRAAALQRAKQREKMREFVHPDPVYWISNHFNIPEVNDGRGGPIEMMEYQKDVIREATRVNDDGKLLYNVVVWSDIKKSGKSTIAAAVALWRAFQTNWGSLKVVANDLKQADSRVSYYLRRAIELNPVLKEIVRIKPSGYFVELPNRTIIESIPIDPGGEAGGNDDMIIFSELWAAKNTAIQRMWTEMTLSPTKEGKSQRWIETYAGFSGESLLLEQLYETGVKAGRNLGADIGHPDLEVFGNEAATMLAMWNTKPRCPWQTDTYYASEAAVIRESEFNRVHRNQWASSDEKFVPFEWWVACNDPELAAGSPPIDREESPCILVADAAVSGDSFGILMISGREEFKTYDDDDEEEKTEWELDHGAHFDVRYANAWYPPLGGKIDYQGSEEAPGPELEIRRLIDEFNVVEFVYDPFQLEDLAGRLQNDLVTRIYAFTQGQERLIADKLLYEKIRARRVHHTGEHDLSEHVKNANAKIDGEDRKMRIVKRSPHLKVDLCVCLSMAVARAEFWRI